MNRLIVNTGRLVLIVIMTQLTACSTAPRHWERDTSERINHSLQEAGADSAKLTVDEISQALLPSLPQAQPAPARQLSEPRFDLATKNTPARSVFMSLVNDTPYSMVIHPDVSGTISLTLKNVTVEEAMETIKKVYGYDYKREGNRFLVLGRGMQTRIYPVNYLNLERRGFSNTRVAPGELTDSSSSSGDASGAGDSGGSGGGSSAQTQGISVETRSNADFWSELKQTLEGIIGTDKGRHVAVNPQAGLVIVRAMPNELDLVENFLGMTQSNVNRQVILEAKIIEVELKDSFQSGINWASLSGLDRTDVYTTQVGGGTLLSGAGLSNLSGQSADLNPKTYSPLTASASSPLASGATSAFGGIFSMAIAAPNFTAFIELLQNQGDVHVLSSPRISTVNNQKAVIKVGGDEFFVTGVKNNTTVTSSATTQAPEVELTPFFSGIALDVTPQIDSSDNIILHIHPTVSNVTQRDKNFVVSGASFNLPLAFSTIQESDNVVRSKNGQVIIIGGLMKEASTNDEASVPMLGDIPVIGNLFRHKKLARIKKELVILLKPSVINLNDSWRTAIGESYERTRLMKRTVSQ